MYKSLLSLSQSELIAAARREYDYFGEICAATKDNLSNADIDPTVLVELFVEEDLDDELSAKDTN